MTDKHPVVLALKSPKTGEALIYAGEFHPTPCALVLPDAEAASFAEHFEAVPLTFGGRAYAVVSASSVGLTDERVTPANASA